MEIVFHREFKKKYKKLPVKIQSQFNDRLKLFVKDKTHSKLNNHSVDTAFTDCRSINVTGDYRAIFKEENNVAVFVTIGKHSELY
jgi:addiction module RelE/StbE family toxin